MQEICCYVAMQERQTDRERGEGGRQTDRERERMWGCTWTLNQTDSPTFCLLPFWWTARCKAVVSLWSGIAVWSVLHVHQASADLALMTWMTTHLPVEDSGPKKKVHNLLPFRPLLFCPLLFFLNTVGVFFFWFTGHQPTFFNNSLQPVPRPEIPVT